MKLCDWSVSDSRPIHVVIHELVPEGRSSVEGIARARPQPSCAYLHVHPGSCRTLSSHSVAPSASVRSHDVMDAILLVIEKCHRARESLFRRESPKSTWNRLGSDDRESSSESIQTHVPPIDRSSDGAVDGYRQFQRRSLSLRISCESFTARPGNACPFKRQASSLNVKRRAPFKLA